MRAIVMKKTGSNFSGMSVVDIKPVSPLPNNYLRIKMAASRINPADADILSGSVPFLAFKDRENQPDTIGGIDGAGIVVEVGSEASSAFAVNDKVFFYRQFVDVGAWAQEIVVPASWATKIPASLSVHDAGAMALPSLTAYEAIKSMNPEKDKTILILGAGGGVGFQAVQISLALGLRVIATASPRSFDLLKEAGVSEIVDYRKEKFDEVLSKGEVDYIIDVAGKDPIKKLINLGPKKVVSLSHMDASQMPKIGAELGWFWKSLIWMMSSSANSLAKKKGVELRGQVTGPDGKLMADCVALMSTASKPWKYAPCKTLTLDDIEKKGLSGDDVGKLIILDN